MGHKRLVNRGGGSGDDLCWLSNRRTIAAALAIVLAPTGDVVARKRLIADSGSHDTNVV